MEKADTSLVILLLTMGSVSVEKHLFLDFWYNLMCKIKKNLKGFNRIYWYVGLFTFYILIGLYHIYILHWPNHLLSMAWFIIPVLLADILVMRRLGPNQVSSLVLYNDKLLGRHYRTLKKFKVNIKNITDIKYRKRERIQRWIFGSRYTIYFNDNESIDCIDVSTEFFNGVQELMQRLIKSGKCPVTEIKEELLREKEK